MQIMQLPLMQIYGGFYVDSGCANLVASCGGSRVLFRAVRADNGFALFDRGASRGQRGPTRGPVMVWRADSGLASCYTYADSGFAL